MSIAPFSFDAKATDAQKLVIKPALEQAAATLGSLLKPITLVPKTSGQMPKWDGSNPAWGLWKGYVRKRKRREIWYWDQLHLRPECGPTILHEAMHALDEIWLTNSQRSDIMALMKPRPANWLGGNTWGGFPYEVYAVWGSAVVFDLTNPPYKKYLKREIDPLDRNPDPLKAIILRNDGPAESLPLSQPIGE